jgi:hypothetical protein
VVLLVAPAAGCAGGCGSGTAGKSDASDRVFPDVVAPADGPTARTIRPMRRAGFIGLLLRSGHEAGLTPEQKGSIADIQKKLLDEEPPLSLAEFQADLVAGIRAGKLDADALEADYAAIDKVLLARQDKQAEAIGALHEALDAVGRGAVLTVARARLEAMFRARPDLLDAGVPEAGAQPAWVKHRIHRVRAELGLDDAEEAKVAPLVLKAGVSPAAAEATRDIVRKHAEELLDAFEKDALDPTKLDLSTTGGKASPHAALERETKLVGLLLPLITPEQREKLATLRQRRPVGRWTADAEPWSPFDEVMEPAGPR